MGVAAPRAPMGGRGHVIVAESRGRERIIFF